jgi:hypothetical protein
MNKDIIRLILALLLTVLAVYGVPAAGLPVVINQAVFLILIFYIFRTDDDLFWLVWFYVVNNAPGRLLIGSSTMSIYGLPEYPLLPGLSIAFQELFIVMYLLKRIRFHSDKSFIFSKQIQIYLAVGLFYFAISFAYNMSANNVLITTRYLLPWLLLLIVPRYLKSSEDLKRVYIMLIPIILINFITMMQYYVTGVYLHNILSGVQPTRLKIASEEYLSRGSSAETILYLMITLSMYFLAARRKVQNTNLTAAMALLCTFTVFLSGTRGWLIAMVIIYSSFFFIPGFGFFKQIARMMVIVGLMVVALFNLFPFLSTQSFLAIERYQTLGFLAEGDLTAGGTLSRLTDIGPRVMQVFRQSPVIGWAFSSTFWNNANMHVGHQTNLLNLGVLGFSIINWIYVTIVVKTFRYGRNHVFKIANGNAHIVFVCALIGMFAIHSTSVITWGYIASGNAIFWAFFLAAVNAELSMDRQGKGNAA